MDFYGIFEFKLFLKPNFLSLTYMYDDKLFYFRFIYEFCINRKKFAWWNCLLFTDEAEALSKEENNFFRLYFLCQKIATQAVRGFFDSKVPGHTLDSFLKQHRSSLTSISSVCRCTKDQVVKLFPGEFFLIAMSINIGRNILIAISDRQSVHRSNLAYRT